MRDCSDLQGARPGLPSIAFPLYGMLVVVVQLGLLPS